MLEALLALALPIEHRQSKRRVINLQDFGRKSGADIIAATVTDLSAAGCRLSTGAPFTSATVVWLKIAGLAPHRARLEPQGKKSYRCEFLPPVQSGVVEDVLATQERLNRERLRRAARRLG